MSTLVKPFVVLKPVARENYWHSMGQTKVAVVCHTTGGSLAGTDAWFNNPISQASTNFAIGQAGEIHQYIDPAGLNAPAANGLVRRPNGMFPILYEQQGRVNPNFWTVSIEHEGFPSREIKTEPMLESSLVLAAWVCQQFRILPDRSHFFSHTEIDAQKPDPGWSEEFWNYYLAQIAARLKEDNMPPTPEFEALKAEVAALKAEIERVRQGSWNNDVATRRSFEILFEAMQRVFNMWQTGAIQ